MEPTRFLRMGALGSATLIPKAFNSIEQVAAASAAVADRAPDEVAQDEFYWREIQEAFTLDRTLINLNNGNTLSEPARRARSGQALHGHGEHAAGAVQRHDRAATSEPCAARLAAEFGCDAVGAGDDAQRQRVAADRPERHRPEAGRRGASRPSRTIRAC